MNTYHATPYDIHATGFYFSDYDDYLKKAETHKNEFGDPVEEFEIQFIDGENAELFKALDVSQASLELWFQEFEGLDGYDLIAAIYLADHVGYGINEITSHIDDVRIFKGSAEAYAEDYIEDTGLLAEIPEHLQFYFDVERFARDMVLGGDITEVTIMNSLFTIQEC